MQCGPEDKCEIEVAPVVDSSSLDFTDGAE